MILLKNRDRNPSFKKGEYVEINDAGNYPMELSVDGVCEQKATNGKNKLPNNATSKTLKGVTFTKNSDGTVVANGTATASCFYNIISDNEVPITTTNLILSGCPLGGTSSSYRLRATYTDSSYSEDVGNSIKLKDGKVLQIVTIVITNGTTCNNLTFKPMISSDGGEHEPYTGGQPSPSPDYPQPIEVITEDFDLVSCGKNEFNYTNASPNNGITPILNEDGSITCKGVQGQDFFSITKYINNDIPKGTHILSIDKIVDTNIIIRFSKADGSKKEYTIYKGQKNVTFESKDEYLGYYIYSYLRGSVGKKVDLTIKLQIEKGDKASEFEPYQETRVRINLPDGEFIGKLDDTYKDTLKVEYNEEDGQYHLVLNKMIGKIVLNGSETFYINAYAQTLGYNIFVYKGLTNSLANGDNSCKSNYFIHYSWGQFDSKDAIYQNSNWIMFKCDSLNIGNDIDKFKEWLSTHNTEVYYPLATPYEIDLGIVDTLLSYDEVTNIFTDSDLYPVINVKYYKDFEFDKILRSGYNIDEQEYEIAKKQMANGKRKRILSSYDDCIIKINLGLLDNKTYQEYKEQLDDGEFHYWSYKYNQYKKANFILTKPSITTEYAYDDDIGIDDMEITLEKSSDIE